MLAFSPKIVISLWALSAPSAAFQARSSFAGSVQPSRPRRPTVEIRHAARRSRSGKMSMHLGHSHSHHHHSHEEKETHQHEVAAPPKGALGRVLFLTRRRPARIAFAALATLGPALLRTGRISQTNFALFAITSTVLSLFDAGRREVKSALSRINNLRRGIVKHAPTLEEMSPIRMMGGDNDADRVTIFGVLVNLVLSVGKAAVGITCHSSALVADAGHSLSDLFSDFITLWAVQIGRLPPDDDHPYGHGKFEAVGSLFLALTLLATGLGVGAASNKKLIEILNAQRLGVAAATVEIPTSPALVVAGLSIASKEWLYRITRVVGERLNSQVVIANAWHHRSDAYSSVLSMASIAMAMTFPSLLAADAAAGMLVAGMICMTGAEILGESIKQLTDTSDEGLVDRVTQIVSRGEEDVLDVKRVRARQVGSSSVVDVSVGTPAGLSSSANRAIEERLKVLILQEPGVVDAEVRSQSGGEVVCPLLTAEAARPDGVVAHPPSAAQVEDLARSVLERDDRVRSVEDVTVHYQDTILMNVDATIRMDNLGSTVSEAAEVAKQLRQNLEGEDNIHKANLFLDLNEGSVPAVAAAMPRG
uniref:Cation efflux protein transmembrane domain-containing protein n=1 Tax=Odontella aurita TaxID=265563 RepID=A0A7S4I154_9STRA|mmetsp:Transcript_18288/g.52801  ORF Transcript_18288/g.52801 Transcript_18288/m.52801 type:complete len:591 (+) Transcript_18288:261-2033(+)